MTISSDPTPHSYGLPDPIEMEALLSRNAWRLRVKRAIDLIGGIVLLTISLPVLLVAGLLVRIDSPGPIVFRQLRWGRDGRQFVCFKLRTMRLGEGGDVNPVDATGQLLKSSQDVRVTRIGRVLRRTSVDELLQFWNVIRGDMSLVGPRPLMLSMLEPYPEIQAVRGKVRPGLTGIWQISHRTNNTHVLSMIEHDLAYVRGLSLRRDVKILLLTVGAVFGGRGAV